MPETTPPSGPSPTVAGPGAPPPTVVRDTATTDALRRRRSRQRRVQLAGVVGALAAIVLIVLSLVLPAPTPAASGTGIPFSQARALASAAIPSGFAASPEILGAAGIDSRPGVTLSAATFTANASANCTVSHLASYPPSGTWTVPPFVGSFAAGNAPFWIFVFAAGSSGPYLVVLVDNGTASAEISLAGTGCTTGLPGSHPLPSAVADSPAASSSAWDYAGSAYVGGHPNATTMTMLAYGGATSGFFTSPLWGFVYAPCSPLAGGTTSRPALIVAVGIASAVPSASLPYSFNCPA